MGVLAALGFAMYATCSFHGYIFFTNFLLCN